MRLPRFRTFSALTAGVVGLVALGSTLDAKPAAPAKPALDPTKIVNRSLNFLREREPEMNEVEHALYQRMIPIVEATPQLALELLETMLADDQPESAAFEFVLGNVYYTLQRMDGAELHFRKAVNQHPEFLRAWVNLGAVYYATQRYRDAIPCFAKAVALGDREASTFGLLGSSLRETGNYFGAESAYKQAMTSEPGNPDWINGLLEIYLQTEQHPPAAALARELLYAKPQDPRNWTLYSGLLVLLKRPTEAMAVLQTGGDLGLIADDGWLVLGDLYAEAQLRREAVQAYARSAGRIPGPRALLYVRSLIHENRVSEAEACVAELATRNDPALRSQLHQATAAVAVARGRPDEARAELESALKLDPLDGDVLLALANVHREAGETAAAELLYEQASRQPTSAFAAYVELAQLSLRVYNYEAAIRYCRAALELRSSPEVQEFLTRVETLAARQPAPPHRT